MAPFWRRDSTLPRICPDGVEEKNPPRPSITPRKKGKPDVCGSLRSPHVEHTEMSCTYWYHTDLILTATLDKVAKEEVENSKESSLILSIAVDNRD